MTPDEAEAAQRAYRTRRRKWAYGINRPYREDLGKPDPGAVDATDPENG